MEQFLSKHADNVTGTLSGFDRLVFRGTLRMLAHRGGMLSYLCAARVLLKEFAAHAQSLHAQSLTDRLKQASEALARRIGRPIEYLPSSAIDKEAKAREIACRDGIERGLICILTVLEPCQSYEISRDRTRKMLDLRPRQRRCLYLYHYQIHPRFGFMHARIQTWFPFGIQICLNGREWLARSMDAAGLGYQRRDNCFTWLQDAKPAQRMMDRQVCTDWPTLLNAIARGLNPQHTAMFADFPMEYYWSTYQSEWATDIMFGQAARLAQLYPRLVQHGLTTFLSPDVMRFLGRRAPAIGIIPPRLEAEVVSDVKRRPEGVRIKHRVGENSIKMYDKQGSVLRVETTINPRLRRGRLWVTSRPSAPPRTSRMPSRAGSACARGSPICRAEPRCRRLPTTATSTRSPRWKTPPRWVNWLPCSAGRPATRPVGCGRSTRTQRTTRHC